MGDQADTSLRWRSLELEHALLTTRRCAACVAGTLPAYTGLAGLPLCCRALAVHRYRAQRVNRASQPAKPASHRCGACTAGPHNPPCNLSGDAAGLAPKPAPPQQAKRAQHAQCAQQAYLAGRMIPQGNHGRAALARGGHKGPPRGAPPHIHTLLAELPHPQPWPQPQVVGGGARGAGGASALWGGGSRRRRRWRRRPRGQRGGRCQAPIGPDTGEAV